MIRTSTALLAMLAVAPAPSPLDQRARVPEEPGRSVSDAPPVSIAEAGAECLELPWDWQPPSLSDHLLSQACEVVASGELARNGDLLWRWARYRRLRVYGPGADTRPEDLEFFPDTTREDDLVLFAGTAGTDSTRPVWQDRSDVVGELIQDPFKLPLGNGAALLIHRRCLNGTGGCSDYPYELSAEGAVTPLRMTYVEQVLESLPEGWGTWKGIWLSSDSLSAWAGVYVPGDPNSTPSFRATAGLRIENGELRADSVVIAPDTGSSAWKVSEREGFGHITSRASETELARRYGASQVREAEIYLAEGFCTPGTLVFPGTGLQVEVAWADSARTRPAFARTHQKGGPWRTWEGVQVGIALDSLEAIAGEPLSFGGFGWDYGGGLNWDDEGGSIGLRLALVPSDQIAGLSDPRVRELFGDRAVRSDHPLVRQLHIEVAEMGVGWAAPAVERECKRGGQDQR